MVLSFPIFCPTQFAIDLLDDFDKPECVQTVEKHACRQFFMIQIKGMNPKRISIDVRINGNVNVNVNINK